MACDRTGGVPPPASVYSWPIVSVAACAVVALLSDESRTRYKEGQPITEVKTENSINRLTSMANPRSMERVLPESAAHLKRITTGADTVMELPAEAF